MNAFRIPDEEDTLLREQTEGRLEPCRDRIDEIRRFKDTRDPAAVSDHFHRLRELAGARENLIPAIGDALEANLTHGEISGALRLGSGEPYDPLGFMELV